jgi:hypothetical protein
MICQRESENFGYKSFLNLPGSTIIPTPGKIPVRIRW